MTEFQPTGVRFVFKFAKIAFASVAALLLCATAGFAQEEGLAGARSLIEFSGSFGVGLVVIGAAYGIAKLASAALDGMARQPEVAATIQVAMIIAAALIEG